MSSGNCKPYLKMVEKTIAHINNKTPAVAGPNARAATLGPRFTSQPVMMLRPMATINERTTKYTLKAIA